MKITKPVPGPCTFAGTFGGTFGGTCGETCGGAAARVEPGRRFAVRSVGAALAVALLWLPMQAPIAATPPLLAPLDGGGAQAAVPWRTVALPGDTVPATRFSLVELEGRRVLRVESAGGYANLVHPLDGAAAGATTLQWRWRLDQPLARADLRQREGDDAAMKVCVLFDLPLASVPFVERQLLRLARSRSAEPLPSATLCYVWDTSLPTGSLLPNAYTRRLRWLVLRGSGEPLAAWREERRDLRADFLRAFGDEARQIPPISAVAVGADADNTGGQALGYVDALELRR